MATLKLKISTRKNKSGKYPIRLHVLNGKSQSSIATDIEAMVSEWSKRTQRLKGHSNIIDRDNARLDSLVEKVQSAIFFLRSCRRLDAMKASEIINYAMTFNDKVAQIGEGDFIQYWQDTAMLHPKSSTKYTYALKALINFHIMAYGTNMITFHDITSEYVRLYLAHLKENGYKLENGIKYLYYSQNTIYSYAATFKAVINNAIDDEKMLPSALKGFRRSVRQPSKSKVYALTMEQLRAFYRANLPTATARMARDMFILSFCFRGMNLTDIYNLKARNFNKTEGEISYVRAKTGKEVDVKINHLEQILAICEPYTYTHNIWGEKYNDSETKTRFQFAFYYHYANYDNFKSLIIKTIRKLRTDINLPETTTFYTARDTWATIASRDYDLGQEYVDAGLGHSSKSLAVNHYINIDMDKITSTHFKMLEALFDDTTQSTN